MQASKPSVVRFVLVISALALAAVAQLLIGDGNFRLAIAPLLVSVGAIALATARMPLPSLDRSQVPPDEGDSSTSTSVSDGGPHQAASRRRELLFGLVAFTLSLGALIAALARFEVGPSNTMAWYLYGASVVLLLLALPTLDSRWTRLARRWGERPYVSVSLKALLPWVGLAAILVLASAVRLHDLDEMPAGLWYDEADNLAHALRIRNDPGSTPVFERSTNLPSLFLMPIAVVIELTGVTITAGRLVSVAFGLAGIVAVFLLVRLMLGPPLGLVAAFLLAVMRWDINWSRIGMHGITAPLFAALTAYLTLRALRSGRISDFGYAGASLGLGMWFYASFRLFPLVIGFILLHHLLFRQPDPKRVLGQLSTMVVMALAVGAPVLQSSVREPDAFFARSRTTSVFNIMPFGDTIPEMWKSLGKHALMFNHEGDLNPRHNLPAEPMLDFISGLLLLLGLGVALARWRNIALVSLPFWLLFMVIPGVVTLPWEAPQSLRSITVIPAVVGVITLALGVLWWVGTSVPWRTVRRATPVALLALLGGIAFLNVDTYFGEQAGHPKVFASFSTDETLMARDMVEQQRRGHTLFVSRQFRFSLTTSLLADSPKFEVIRAPTQIPIDLDRVWLGASIYLEPREASVYRLLKTYYPDGRFTEVRPPGGGDVLYYSAALDRSHLAQRQGLSGRYTLADGSVREAVQPTTEGVWALDFAPEDVPFDVIWQGALHVVVPGQYLLELQGEARAEVALDGRRLLWGDRTSVRIDPAVGLHSIEVTAHVRDRAEALRLAWQPPGGELVPIPAEHLFRGSVRPVGLTGRFYRSAVEAQVADAMRVTPAMDTFYYDPVIPEPYLAIWEGMLDVPVSGGYRFEVRGAGIVRLQLDGQLRAQNPPSGPAVPSVTVTLDAGKHPIRVEYVSDRPPSEFEVLWAPPGVGLEPIPIDRLSPAQEQMFRVIGEE